MFTAADLIDVVIGRGQPRLWFRIVEPRPAGEFPPAWKAWFAMMSERVGAVTGATSEAIVAIFLQRELASPPPHAGVLNRWQSFATLWRQQWQPPEAEDRRIRGAAIVITFVVQIVLLLVLLWLAYARFTGTPVPQGEEVVQVEYVGQGTPEDQGGGPLAGSTSAPAVASHAPAVTHVQAPPQPPAAASRPTTAAASASQPASAVPVVDQPLQVTQKAIPDTTFVLPPPTPSRVEIPQAQLAVPALQVPTRDVQLIERLPPVRAIQPDLPAASIRAPELKMQPVPIAVVTPAPAVQRMPAKPSPPTPPLPEQAKAPPAPVQQMPEPAATATSTSTSPVAKSSTNTPPGVAVQPAGAPATESGTQPAAKTSGHGPAISAKPGAFKTPLRGDDWGVSTRNRPGSNAGKSGLFNADGSPNLAPGTAQAGGGFPPGSDRWSHDQFDHAGTWLKRPPNDYTPTRFDKVWIPNETLLEQWVRQNIRQVSIPIPGTTKKLNCVVSLLQLGGGCSISDPNLNDQEAEARPPPDIPFKRELQEDQKSLEKSPNPW
jgi:hypothetical protein